MTSGSPRPRANSESLSRSGRRISFGTDGAIRALEERRNSNTYHINRLLDLCKALTQRMTESTSSSEIDEIRGDLARYRKEMKSYEQDNKDVVKQLRGLKTRSGV